MDGILCDRVQVQNQGSGSSPYMGMNEPEPNEPNEPKIEPKNEPSMNLTHSYTLEKYKTLKSRHTCPACNSKNEFARYVDTDGNYLAHHVGRCNRESKCGYHFKPSEYFQSNPTASIQAPRQAIPIKPKPIQYIPSDKVLATLKAYDQNSFVIYLLSLFDSETVQSLIDTYGLGTTKDGSCIFWQVDETGKVRTGQASQYGLDGHRIKGTNRFIHTSLGIENTCQCLFGLHQLIVEPNKPIGLVESEKTAVIMAGKLPSYSWMATCGKNSKLIEKVYPLKRKKVVAFPDGDAFELWKEKLSPYGFKVSDALQKYLTPDEQKDGKDLADFIKKPGTYSETLKDGRIIKMHPNGYPLDWAV